jgi:hypothetical protein
MSYGLCIFCNSPEPDYKPGANVNFICSRCVLLLADANHDDLKQAYFKAKTKGFENKVSALESFIIEDEINDRKTKNSKPNLERTRPLRKVRPSRHQVRA